MQTLGIILHSIVILCDASQGNVICHVTVLMETEGCKMPSYLTDPLCLLSRKLEMRVALCLPQLV